MRIENRTLDDLNVGDTAEMRRLITADDLYAFAAISGNHNPMHLPDLDGDGDGLPEGIAPGLFVGALISTVLGMKLPGPGTLYRSQTLHFAERAEAGEELVARVAVAGKSADGRLRLTTEVRRAGDGALIVSGEAEVQAPQRKAVFEDIDLPGLTVQRHRHFEALLERARALPAMPTAVVCPEEESALEGALLAEREGVILPILVGDRARILAVAGRIGADPARLRIVEAAGPEAAARAACALVHEGRAAALMKGHLHTDDLLRPILDKAGGLRTGRRLSHCYVMDVPGLPGPVMVTDAAINIAPDLAAKVDIVQNAIDLARSLGMATPRVGVLSAVETVNPAIPSSIDAAILSKMAERGQITGGLVDGPLAMDNAISLAAARSKGLRSEVAGRADILVVPGIDAGNMLAKQMAITAHAEGAGLVMGAQVPVILTSRADTVMSRLASCALAALHDARRRAEGAG